MAITLKRKLAEALKLRHAVANPDFPLAVPHGNIKPLDPAEAKIGLNRYDALLRNIVASR